MKTYRLTYVGAFLGIAMMFFAVYRYLFMYYDPSQALIFCGFAIGIWGFSFIHNWHCDRDEQFADLKKDVSANHKYLNEIIEPKLIKLMSERRI